MVLQAIDQTAFPEVLGKTKVFYCPRLLDKDIEHFGLSQYREKSGLYKVDSFNFLLVYTLFYCDMVNCLLI
jgi:hypothetical protein